ncbi:hypothetical protein AA0111_g7946 [Alternaria arborescens]|uniref:hypothetical protein n=1 Tax=Alternaria arborescens TaxID=156630 RepID=UPI0010757238|nr:hypothetical protein AA0111_g7946 [Alternaria arborescens]RYO26457.1 hypothetical protein AA0111_g7946 [Alternaria arborescens]
MVEDDPDSSSDENGPPTSEDASLDSDSDTNYPNTVDSRWAVWINAELRKKSKLSAFNKTAHEFVPNGIVDELITEKAIRGCLKARKGEHIALVDFILTHAKTAFAIATFARLNSHRVMNWFLKHEFSDEDLPVKEQTGPWTQSWRVDFYDAQWRFCAPVLNLSKHIHDFEEALILPVVSMSPVGGQGAFGMVSQYEIHGNHIVPKPANTEQFAVKEIIEQADSQDVAEHWEKEVKALRMMNELNQEHIVRFITAFRRLRRSGVEEHYVMFEWANGGNLRNLWERVRFPDLEGSLVKDTIKQILGLASALQAAHNLNKTEASYRHGDLKPENILIFKTGEETLGTLKIGDWGEAKYHGENQVTEMRSKKTTARFGTRRYEAPEVVTGIKVKRENQPEKRRSRLYDIWAMGCITLEFIVWLLYGLDGLNKFNQDVDGDTFYQTSIENGIKVARLHDAVVRWMDHMANEPACELGSTAIGDLLDIVRSSLLVVKLPSRGGLSFMTAINEADETAEADRPRADSLIDHDAGRPARSDQISEMDSLAVLDTRPPGVVPAFVVTGAEGDTEDSIQDIQPVQPLPGLSGPARCLASTFSDKVDQIWCEDDIVGYWDTHTHHLRVPVGLASSSTLQVVDNRNGAASEDQANYDPSELDEHDWKLRLDNSVASSFLSGLRENGKLEIHQLHSSTKLCDRCKEFRTRFGPTFDITYNPDKLHENTDAGTCDMCTLLWHVCKDTGSKRMQAIRLDRKAAFLELEHNHKLVLSVVRDPAVNMPGSSDFQTGFVELPEAGGITHLEVVRSWLDNCDTNEEHKCKPHVRNNGVNGSCSVRMPTRLIDVGVEGDPKVYLRKTEGHDDVQWIALSHKWGQNNYSTTKDNVQSHSTGLDYDTLPATFKDAVRVTRALNHRYLWIDSLCIIQGDDGDFETEAKRMEDVYSGAYCVIAATRAADHYAGFLGPRKPRKYVGLVKDGKNETPYYICENIDDFQSHVLDGDLNGRGWVLQEHALARRTIFFTEYQTYFECSIGVRCETSTKLENSHAAFLGDADFPNVLYRASQADKIVRIQELYKKYSKLGLSKSWDRPVAIDGLQSRLLRTLRVVGDFGILEGATRGLLRRTLLWRRHTDTTTMSRIDFAKAPTKTKLHIPSWSWMAYTGSIDYVTIDWGAYTWENIQSPWSQDHNRFNVDPETAKMTIVATASQYDLGAATQAEIDLIFDSPEKALPSLSLCVVLGKAKNSAVAKDQKNCLLIVKPITRSDGSTVYERIGTGFLPGKCISPKTDIIKIC